MDYFNSFESHMVSHTNGIEQNYSSLLNKLMNQPAIYELCGLKQIFLYVDKDYEIYKSKKTSVKTVLSVDFLSCKSTKKVAPSIEYSYLIIYFFVFQDFEGQSKAEFVSRTIVVLFGVVGFVFGWYIEQFSQTVYILGAGLVFAAIVSVLYKFRNHVC